MQLLSLRPAGKKTADICYMVDLVPDGHGCEQLIIW